MGITLGSWNMNIWVEYFRHELGLTNTPAQIREQDKWIKPDSKDIHKRFCQDMDEAIRFANSMTKQGYHATIKTDGVI